MQLPSSTSTAKPRPQRPHLITNTFTIMYNFHYTFECFVPITANRNAIRALLLNYEAFPPYSFLKQDYEASLEPLTKDHPSITFPAFESLTLIQCRKQDFDGEFIIFAVAFTF